MIKKFLFLLLCIFFPIIVLIIVSILYKLWFDEFYKIKYDSTYSLEFKESQPLEYIIFYLIIFLGFIIEFYFIKTYRNLKLNK